MFRWHPLAVSQHGKSSSQYLFTIGWKLCDIYLNDQIVSYWVFQYQAKNVMLRPTGVDKFEIKPESRIESQSPSMQ